MRTSVGLFYLLIYLSYDNLHCAYNLRLHPSRYFTASLVKSLKSSTWPLYLVSGHSRTMWRTVCDGHPHAQYSWSLQPHFFRRWAQCPIPVLSRLSMHQTRRCLSKPGGRARGCSSNSSGGISAAAHSLDPQGNCVIRSQSLWSRSICIVMGQLCNKLITIASPIAIGMKCQVAFLLLLQVF